MKNPALFAAALAALLPLLPAAASGQAPSVKLSQTYEGLKLGRMVTLQVPPDGTSRRFVAEQKGKIKILPADESATSGEKVFIDLADRMAVEKDFEEGLIGFTFHPDYAKNRKFYLVYSKQGPKRSVVSEFQTSAEDPSTADPSSERVLMQILQPEWNHNSGNLVFGPKDGYLYLAVGDGGLKNGVFLMAPKLHHWHGKILRIDVNKEEDGRPYGIPADNPFVDVPHACPEIWAYGFRNPWGSWIDPQTGLFWVADVGQDLYEEINLVEKGGHYGWHFREGFHEFPGYAALMQALLIAPEKPRGLIDPIHEYPRTDGLSITGGYVYHGDTLPGLKGCYLYGDWALGNLWALDYDAAGKKTRANHVLFRPVDNNVDKIKPTAIYPDEKGEPVILNMDGRVFRFQAK